MIHFAPTNTVYQKHGVSVMKKWLALLILILLMAWPLLSWAQTSGESVIATVVPDDLFVREAPSARAEAVGSFKRGTQLLVSGREDNTRDDGSWVFVTPVEGGPSGWVKASFLLFPANYNIGALPVVSTTGVASGLDAPLIPAPSAPSANTNVASVAGGLSGRTTDIANFRSGPELTFDILAQLPRNTEVLLTGRNSNGVWLQAVANGQVGWLFFSLVATKGDTNSLPVISGDPLVAETAGLPAATDGLVDVTQPQLGVSPNTPPGQDGRLNTVDDLGPIIVYCFDRNNYTNTGTFAGGGIAVFNWQANKYVLVATEGQINAVGSNPPNGAVIASQNGYGLYRLEEGLFLLTGPDSTGKGFSFRWSACRPGSRVG
jgi:uncharacterized protein YgiM (DUF1202 family)